MKKHPVGHIMGPFDIDSTLEGEALDHLQSKFDANNDFMDRCYVEVSGVSLARMKNLSFCDLKDELATHIKDGFTHLDVYLEQMVIMGDYEIIASTKEDACGDCDDSYDEYIVIKADKGMTIDKINESIREDFGYRDCGHEHDCCGCHFTRPWSFMTTRIKGTDLHLVVINHYWNR